MLSLLYTHSTNDLPVMLMNLISFDFEVFERTGSRSIISNNSSVSRNYEGNPSCYSSCSGRTSSCLRSFRRTSRSDDGGRSSITISHGNSR